MLAEKYGAMLVGVFADQAVILELADPIDEGITDTNVDAVTPID